MTELLYLCDSYLKEFEAKVIAVNEKHVFLDRTAFYPNSGGQLGDIGSIVKLSNGLRFSVLNTKKSPEGICHEVDKDGLAAGDSVKCEIDWQRRYKLMRMHTAAHMLSAIINTRSGALITGNQLGTDQSRMDFSLENFDRDAMASICEAANTHIKEDHAVKIYFLPREEAMKIPSVVKLAGALPPNLETLRIVEIESVDKSLDGGTHVANLAEIGTIEIVKMENKGKSNRRVYFAVKP